MKRGSSSWFALALLGCSISACSLVMAVDDLGNGVVTPDSIEAGSADSGTDPTNTADATDATTSPDDATTGDSGGGEVIFQEDFESFAVAVDWAESSNQGPNWFCSYDGNGAAGIELDGTNKVQSQSTQPPPSSGSLSSLVRTTRTFGDIDFSIRVKTVAQQRPSNPDPSEVAQVLWHLDAKEDECLYLMLRSNGWEIGRKGVVSGGQSVLMSGTDMFPIGQWAKPRIRHVGTTITLWLTETSEPRTFQDSKPASQGTIGLYVDDAHVQFDDLVVRNPN